MSRAVSSKHTFSALTPTGCPLPTDCARLQAGASLLTSRAWLPPRPCNPTANCICILNSEIFSFLRALALSCSAPAALQYTILRPPPTCPAEWRHSSQRRSKWAQSHGGGWALRKGRARARVRARATSASFVPLPLNLPSVGISTRTLTLATLLDPCREAERPVQEPAGPPIRPDHHRTPPSRPHTHHHPPVALDEQLKRRTSPQARRPPSPCSALPLYRHTSTTRIRLKFGRGV